MFVRFSLILSPCKDWVPALVSFILFLDDNINFTNKKILPQVLIIRFKLKVCLNPLIFIRFNLKCFLSLLFFHKNIIH